MKTIPKSLFTAFVGCAVALVGVQASTSGIATEAGAPAGAGPGILTPPAPATPRINGPAIFGARPGSPFLYAIPATGDRPMTFGAEGLPDGLKIDASTGRITGAVAKAGEYTVTLTARNALGENSRKFRVVIGEKIALTPPMGWNSWNCWGGSVTQEKVLSSAEALVKTGLDQHGWSYINIDDGWQGPRGGVFAGIQPNPKFPDIQGLAAQLHGLGLKFGVYSTPWTLSYGGYIGSGCRNADGTYDWVMSGEHDAVFHIEQRRGPKHEVSHDEFWKFGQYSFAANDARQWAAWGVDYLKYDWNPIDVAHTAAMGDALRASGRDIVYSLSNSAPFEHAADWQRLATSWRTTGDITDTWESMKDIGFEQAKWAKFAGPGHWNDPDMLIVGRVGWGKPHPTRLTEDEQYTHMSLWCLLSAPLLIGCDLAKVDAFTLSLLSNDEVLAVDQDALGKEATPIMQDKEQAVYAKPMEDGSWAVGLFNLSESPRTVSVTWSDLKLAGTQRVRDLWRQKDLGVFPAGCSATVDGHGAVFVRVFSTKQ